MSQQSFDNINNANLFGGSGSKSKNWGGQVGVKNTFFGVLLNANFSYIKDIRDADYLSGGSYLFNSSLKTTPIGAAFLQNQVILMQRIPGVAVHGDAQYGPFGLLAEYVTATRTLNPTVPDGKIYAWTVEGNVKFKVLNFDSLFDVSYQRGGNSNVFQTIAIGPTNVPLIPIGNVLPKRRIQFTYSVNVMPNVVVGIQWLRDKDTPSSQGGTNLSSDKGMIRVSAQV